MSDTTTPSNAERLYCEHGQHHYNRERKRGVKPKNCPVHALELAELAKAEASANAEPRVQTLTCQAGHTWTRPAQKGKPPKYCPEHSVKVTTSDGTTTIALSAPTFESLRERFPRMRSEDYYKLQYIDSLLRNDRRKEDHDFTRQTQKQIIARLERQHSAKQEETA